MKESIPLHTASATTSEPPGCASFPGANALPGAFFDGIGASLRAAGPFPEELGQLIALLEKLMAEPPAPIASELQVALRSALTDIEDCVLDGLMARPSPLNYALMLRHAMFLGLGYPYSVAVDWAPSPRTAQWVDLGRCFPINYEGQTLRQLCCQT